MRDEDRDRRAGERVVAIRLAQREARREQARADVALMRELGMLRWGTVWLDPTHRAMPAAEMKPRTPEEQRQIDAAIAQRRHEVLFAASSIKPALPILESDQAKDIAARLERVRGGNRVQPGVTGSEHSDGPPPRKS